jgi:type I restriction enzyme, S subunit
MENNLPQGWVETSLDSICSIDTGKWDANHASQKGRYRFYTCAYDYQFSDTKRFSGECIILPGNGANVGEVFFYDGDFDAYQRTYILSDVKINPKFVFYHLRFLWKEMNKEKQYGSATNYIRIGNFTDYTLQIPPFPEQSRIVAKLDAVMQKVESNKQRLEKIPKLVKRFRQSVLAAAVSGKLTEDWREKNHIVDDWKEKTIRELSSKLTYGSSQKSELTGKVPVLRMGNIQEGKIVWDDLKYSSDDEEIKKYKLENGDVLFNRTNSPELVGKTAIYRNEQPAIYAGYLIKVRTNNKLNPEFLNLCLNTIQAREWCNEVKTDGVSQSNINAQKLAEFIIFTPSIEEQKEIVRRVEQLFAFADKIEARYTKAKAMLDKLPQSILAKAFRGELVPQNPNDEPASVLLTRIKADKEKFAKENKDKKSKKIPLKG